MPRTQFCAAEPRFKAPEAREAVSAAQQELGDDASLDRLVRAALKRLTKG
jgi:hypothetical protein